MMTSNMFSGVGICGIYGVSWTHHVAAPTAAAHAITPRKRRTAAATLASVNRGPV